MYLRMVFQSLFDRIICVYIFQTFSVEQLLLFAEMNASVGNEIKGVSENIIRQEGINDIILSELEMIGEQSKEIFDKTILELMITIISKKLCYSDQLLNLAWRIAIGKDNRDPLKSELWQAIKTQCNDIVKNGSKRDWYWLKKILLPSTVLLCYSQMNANTSYKIHGLYRFGSMKCQIKKKAN